MRVGAAFVARSWSRDQPPLPFKAHLRDSFSSKPLFTREMMKIKRRAMKMRVRDVGAEAKKV
jgi:hypothetical protein